MGNEEHRVTHKAYDQFELAQSFQINNRFVERN